MDLEIIPAETVTRVERLALRVLQLGALAVVVAASLHRGFDLDRFLVPKEVALHATALLAGLLTLRENFIPRVDAGSLAAPEGSPHVQRVGTGDPASSRGTNWLDLALLAFVLLSAISAVFATNPWLGMRALAVSASSYVIFRAARGVTGAFDAVLLLGAPRCWSGPRWALCSPAPPRNPARVGVSWPHWR